VQTAEPHAERGQAATEAAGAVLMWDNHCVMHNAVHDYDHTKDHEIRVMNRVCWCDGVALAGMAGAACGRCDGGRHGAGRRAALWSKLPCTPQQ
jgi:hypothetical protein